MKQVTGDLIEMFKNCEFDTIIHGCNCYSNMGAGIAKTIKQHYPSAYKVDVNDPRKPKQRLGSYSYTMLKNGSIIYNAYTQLNYGRGIQLSYSNLSKSFKLIAEDLMNHNEGKLKIGYPKIGAGLAGGDWGKISPLIDEAFDGLDHTLVVYNPRG